MKLLGIVVVILGVALTAYAIHHPQVIVALGAIALGVAAMVMGIPG